MAKETLLPIEILIEQLHGMDWTAGCDAQCMPGHTAIQTPTAYPNQFAP